MISILHVFGKLTRSGGAEKWVLDLFDLQDSRVRFDFLLSVDDALAEEVRQKGSNVHLVPFSRSPIPYPALNPYLAGVERVLRENRYDVVHVHQYDLAGEILRIAERLNVSVRAMSVHSSHYCSSRIHRRAVFETIGKPWIFRHCTDLLACGRTAGDAFTKKKEAYQILSYGVPLEPFRQAAREFLGANPTKLREEFQIPPNAFVLGNVGRMIPLKNQRFVLRLVKEMLQTRQDVYGVIVGDGPLRRALVSESRRLGIEDRMIFPGIRRDVPNLLMNLFDVFVLPSHIEGCPISAIEAIIAGLPTILSDCIGDDLNLLFPQNVKSLPLHAPLEQWAKTILEFEPPKVDPFTMIETIEKTPLNIQCSLDHLIQIYTKRIHTPQNLPKRYDFSGLSLFSNENYRNCF